MSPAQHPADPKRETAEDGFTHRPMAVNITTPVTANTYRYWLGWADLQGLELVSIQGITGTAIAASTTNYFSFQPIVSRTKADGTVKVTTLGTGVDTQSQGFVADTKRRLHTESRLSYQVPKDAVYGIDLTVTGAPTSVRFTFLVMVRYV